MKKMHQSILTALLALFAISASAQQVTTLYFLENAPMRHTINPAFQPVSQGYVNFSPLGWSSFGLGNNSLTLNDFVYYDKQLNRTITPFYDATRRQALLKTINSTPLGNPIYGSMETTLGLFNFGFRVKDNGYVMIGLNQRIETGATMPKTNTKPNRSMYDFFLDGGIKNLDGDGDFFDLTGMGASIVSYTELSGGYSHKLNEHWTLGGKLKLLLGQAYIGINNRPLNLQANTDAWQLTGTTNLDVAGPLDYSKIAIMQNQGIKDLISGEGSGVQLDELINTSDIASLLIPSGYGAAIDFGATWKPIEQLQISAALTDLGFLYWARSGSYVCVVDTAFTGAGEVDYNDPAYRDESGNFSTAILMDTVVNNLSGLLNGFKLSSRGSGFARMTSARLNVGLDANFWENRIGLGVVSATRLYNARLYEEVTFGFAFRPVNWFNLAATYSLLHNGKYSNFGLGLGFMPYDGINLTLAMDYIPTSYAKIPSTTAYLLPDKTKMFNIAMGFSICWGSNKRDKDKDGIWDKLDQCPDTPRGVQVDSVGCPVDSDHDGVPDYLDNCPLTPAEAIGFVDEHGCPLDSDGDGVEDYKDLCPGTPREAWGKIDADGCPLDSDGDGVPDYLDECPNTPAEAYGKIDAHGCPLDSDGDGVADYLDECPNTPKEAYGKIDSKGCPLDSDNDGVPDYMDECLDTPKEALGFVDEKGCILDSDGDEVPDYKDECPHVAGVKANKGCPEIKREVRQLLQKAMQGIEFETGKATIKAKSHPLLNQIAQIFIENSNYIIEVQGHTDTTGKYEFNKELSDKRANAVRDYLIAQGVDFQRMTAVGYGPDVPIADNKTKAGRQKNRRVEFKITFEEIHYETILDHADPQPEQTPAE